jgi:1-acyl-sn-glycerol-3-phosphate acyltransferase
MIKNRIARVTQFISWPFTFILLKPFLIFKINGRENLEKATPPFLIISNHVSFYDSFVFRLVFGLLTDKLPLRFMAVRKFDNSRILNLLSNLKLVDLTYVLLGAFVVEPGRGIDKNLKEAERIIQIGGSVVMYPEGSVVKEGIVREFKHGAAVLTQRTKVPVLPISMKLGKRRFLRREFVINIGEVISVNREMEIGEINKTFYDTVVGLYNKV